MVAEPEQLSRRELGTLEWWPLRDVSRRWGVSVDTVSRMIGDGEIKGRKFGRQWRIHTSEIERYERPGVRKPATRAATAMAATPKREWFGATGERSGRGR